MEINKISINELLNEIRKLPKIQEVGEKKEFHLSGHNITVESGLKYNCFKLEWKIIEIK